MKLGISLELMIFFLHFHISVVLFYLKRISLTWLLRSITNFPKLFVFFTWKRAVSILHHFIKEQFRNRFDVREQLIICELRKKTVALSHRK